MLNIVYRKIQILNDDKCMSHRGFKSDKSKQSWRDWTAQKSHHNDLNSWLGIKTKKAKFSLEKKSFEKGIHAKFANTST